MTDTIKPKATRTRAKPVAPQSVQNFYCPVNNVAGRDVKPQKTPASKDELQTEFKKITGIWCPVAAHGSLNDLRRKAKSPRDVWLAWRLGYIDWDGSRAQVVNTHNWTHRLMMAGLLVGTGLAGIDLMQVLMIDSPTGKWLAVTSGLSLRLLLLLMALEWLVLSPRRVTRALRAEKSSSGQ